MKPRVHYIAGCLPLRLRHAVPMVLDDRRVWVPAELLDGVWVPVERRVPWYWRAWKAVFA